MKRLTASLLLLLSTVVPALTAKQPPPKSPVIDLTVPYNVQATQLKDGISVTWEWQPPQEETYLFKVFGFDILRNGKLIGFSKEKNYTDFHVPVGEHNYTVVTRGERKEHGVTIIHLSDFSEPFAVSVKQTCPQAPAIALEMLPVRREMQSAQYLRMRLRGQVKNPVGCSLRSAQYHVEGTYGTKRSVNLSLKPDGSFDFYANAVGREEQAPEGVTSFTISATAENEAGITTSDSYTLNLERENPYAPH